MEVPAEEETPRGVCPKCGMDWRPLLEASDLTSPLRPYLAKWRRKMNLLVWLYAVILFVCSAPFELIQIPSKGWGAFAGIVMVVGPLGALIAGFIIGERRVEVRVSRDAGVYCLDCGAAPRMAEMPDWIATNSCSKCGGRLHRDFSNLMYKESWPEWPSHDCQVDEDPYAGIA